MKINKNKVLKDLQSDYENSKTHQEAWVGKRDCWIRETYGKPYGNEVKGRSSIVSKDIKRQLEWLIPSMTDPFLSTPDVIKCNPVTYEDTNAAKQNELLLNTQFARFFDRYNFINKAARVLATEGTCVVQTGWDYKYEEVEVETDVMTTDNEGNSIVSVEKTTQYKTIKNRPTARVCRGEDVFIDPTAMGEFDDAQFIIYRYETTPSSLLEDGRYKNIKKVLQKIVSKYDDDYDPEDSTDFEFNDAARKKLVVYEYWGNYDLNGDGIAEPIVCVWTDSNIIIRLEENPFPDKKPPFIVVPFTPIPFQMEGEALAENISDNQKIKTAIVRGMIDNMARSNNGQVGIRKGALSLADKKKFISGKNFEFNGTPNDFWQGSFNHLPASAFNMLELMNHDIESQTGVSSFSGGINSNSLGSTATGARLAMDSTSMRKLNLIRNISENLVKPLMRKWMSYNAEFLDEEEVIRITNNEFIPIKRDDLEGKIDIDISISTTEDNSAKAQQLSFLLQTIGNSMGTELMQIILSDIASLQKMPELAYKISNYKPQEDPNANTARQLEMQRLQLENEMLKARIADTYSRAEENSVDEELKHARARLENAKADKLLSDRDYVDLKFVKENIGIDHQNRLELEDLKARLNLLSMQYQHKAGDTNIGVIQ